MTIPIGLDIFSNMVQLQINGAAESLEHEHLTIVELLKLKSVESPDMVSVQLNGEMVARAEFGNTALKDGDVVEFLYFMGGGDELSDEQIERYSRHILLKGVGGVGQKRLLNAKVLVVGVGGLGSPIALYLAAAGIGTVGLVDDDRVEISNLQRQIIHTGSDLQRLKVDSARDKIRRMNPDVRIETHKMRLQADNIMELIAPYDFIIEGTDNFPTKFLVNDACILSDKPFNQGGILRFEGQTMTHIPGSASYRCVYRTPPPPGAVPTCSEAGVLGAIPGMLGSIQAAEALKYLLDIGDLLINRVLIFNALTMQFRVVPIKKTAYGDLAAENSMITELRDYEVAACDLPAAPQYAEAEHAETEHAEPQYAEAEHAGVRS